VDQDGLVLDILVQPRRNQVAARDEHRIDLVGPIYDDLGADSFERRDAARLERCHVRRLEQLGYTVTWRRRFRPREARDAAARRLSPRIFWGRGREFESFRGYYHAPDREARLSTETVGPLGAWWGNQWGGPARLAGVGRSRRTAGPR
jgi:hypothetical protein